MQNNKNVHYIKPHHDTKQKAPKVNWNNVKPVEKITTDVWILYAALAFLLGYTAAHFYYNYVH